MRLFFIVTAVCVLAAVPGQAQEKDADGSKDHPMFSRMPGYYIEEYDAQDFSSVELETEPARKVEGRYWKISYWLKENAKKSGPVQIARNYTDLLVKRGGKKLFDDVDSGGGRTVAQMPLANGKNLWLQVAVSNGGQVYDLIVVEEAGMEQKVEFSTMELAAALNANGSVALHNILFDTGRATLKPESAAALAPVGELLKNDAALKLEIQGHTDNVGQSAANLKLSQDRAASVKTHLVQNVGIAAARLTTAGFGDTKPVAPNTSDDGRAQNRRVELVKK
jgi:outer membrane protein OmpA-like peptidoglycan-associated protein